MQKEGDHRTKIGGSWAMIWIHGVKSNIGGIQDNVL